MSARLLGADAAHGDAYKDGLEGARKDGRQPTCQWASPRASASADGAGRRRPLWWQMLAAAAGFSALASTAQAATIGVILPGSWPSVQQAEALQQGMTLALKTWPGDSVPTLIVKDSACDAHKAEQAADALIQAKVDIVLGNWCEIGNGADRLKAAGIPLISSNAERVPGKELQVQLGRIELYAAERIATELRRETGLRISARTSCWLDFEATLSERVDAVLCPVLTVDKTRWDQVANTYTAAFRKPITPSAARGYAAMELALNYLRRAKGGKTTAALKDTQSASTLLGPVPALDAPAPTTALQLVFSSHLPKMSPQQAQTLDKLVKSKGCGCPGGTLRDGCPKDGSPWSDMPFVVRGGGTPAACAAAIGVLEL